LTNEKIKAVNDRIKHNSKFLRVKGGEARYILSGFIRCTLCGHALVGQRQDANGGKYKYSYYRHNRGRHIKCKGFSQINTGKIEEALLYALFNTFSDEKGLEAAMKPFLADETYIKKMENELRLKRIKYDEVNTELDQLVEIVLTGKLEKETIKKKETQLLALKKILEPDIDQLEFRLKQIPSKNKAEKEFQLLQSHMRSYYSSAAKLKHMNFKEKRKLLHEFFDGKDLEGFPYGVYIEKQGRQDWSYTVYGKVVCGWGEIWGDSYRDNEGNPYFNECISRKDNDILKKLKENYFKYCDHRGSYRDYQDFQCHWTA
jgi:hypothetical protein